MPPVESLVSAAMLLAAIAGGYLLGAIPLAVQVSRRRGVDIFSAGSGLAGATNVRKAVGRWSASVVLFGDVAKGMLAVILGWFLGLEGSLILLPALASIVGHWNSVFSGFRGGDGMATLGGVIIVLFPGYGIVSVAVATFVALGAQRVPYSSLINIVLGYLVLAVFSIGYSGDTALTLGCGGLSAIVLAHAIMGHLKRRRADDWDDVDEAANTSEQTQTGP